MNLEIIRQLNIDFYHTKYVSINAKKHDKLSRYILVTCYNQGKMIHIDNTSNFAYIRYKKADTFSVFNSCTITNDGKILVELTEQMLAAAGTCCADLVILNQNDDTNTPISTTTSVTDDNSGIVLDMDFSSAFSTDDGDGNVSILMGNVESDGQIIYQNANIISTMPFYINVLETAFDNTEIESSHEFNALNDLLIKAHNTYENVMENCQTSADNAKVSEDNAKVSEDNAKTSEINANTSESEAKTSENNAKTYAHNAKNSELNAKLSETNSNNSEVAAKKSEEAAKVSEQNAKESEDNAKISETNANNSEVVTKESEESAKLSEQNAKASEEAAKASELAAKTSEENAKASEEYAAGVLVVAEKALSDSEEARANSEQAIEEVENLIASVDGAVVTTNENAQRAESAYNQAVNSASEAAEAANNANNSANEAIEYSEAANNNAILSKSYAVGETNTRVDEDIDNAKYYYLKIKEINDNLNGIINQMQERISLLESQLPQLIFMSDDGKTELCRQVVYNGNGVDPIANGTISEPTKASTAQYYYTFAGWSDTIGGYVSPDVLNGVTADRYVYAVFTELELTDAWTDVQYHIDQGDYATFYSVGDVIPLDVGEETINMEIVAFDHDNLADGSGKAHISFVAKDLLAESKVMNNSEKTDGNGNSGYNIGGWESSDMRLYCNNTIFPSISENVRNMIKSVNKISDGGYYNKVLVTTSDKIWIPSYHEVGLGGSSYIVNGQGTTYPHFVDTSSRIKNKVDSIVDAWWLRSSYTNNKNLFWGINSSGDAITNGGSIANGIAIGFCI